MALKIESTSSPSSKDLISIFLKHQTSGVLATADSAANPYAAVVYYLFEDDFTLLFGTKRETQKYKNMEENPRVSVVVYDEPTQTTVQITGRIEFIEDEDTVEKVVDNMESISARRSIENVPPAAKLTAGDFVAVRMYPQVIKLAEYGFAKQDSADIFETILFSE